MPFASKAIVTVRRNARGIASSASRLAEGSTPSPSATSSSASASRPRSNNQSQRSPQSKGGASDRLRAGQRNRNSTSQRGGERSGPNQNNNRNAGSDRRNKRLPSVFDATSASNQARASRSSNNKSLSNTSQKLSAPLPKTDWNNPLFSKPGFERLLSPAPRPSSVFIPDFAAAAPSAPASGGKGKGKAAAAPAAKMANAKLNLPGIKTANSALKLHIVPGARNILGPTNNPTSVAAGFLTHNRAALTRSSDLKASDDKSLAEQLKEARIALQNEQIGGSYERFQAQSLLKATGVQTDAKSVSLSTKAVQDAAQALAVNPDLAPEGKRFVAQTIADRLGS